MAATPAPVLYIQYTSDGSVVTALTAMASCMVSDPAEGTIRTDPGTGEVVSIDASTREAANRFAVDGRPARVVVVEVEVVSH